METALGDPRYLIGYLREAGTFLGLAADEFVPPKRLESVVLKRAADEVLEAVDLTALREALDEFAATHDPLAIFFAKVGTARARENPRPQARTATGDFGSQVRAWELDQKSLVRTLGEPATAACEKGHEALKAAVLLILETSRGLKQAASGTTTTKKSSPPPEIGKASLGSPLCDLVYNTEVPLAWRRGLLDVLRSFAAGVSIARAEELGEPLDPWMARELGEQFKRGLLELHEGCQRVHAELARGGTEGFAEFAKAARADAAGFREAVQATYEQGEP